MSERYIIHAGEVRDVLATIADDSVDAILSDVPYGYGTKQPTPEELLAYLGGAELDTGGDFMGRDWSVPSVPTWREMFRVLKPGAPLLSFAGSRTVDLIAMGIRAARFEIRDVITYAWVHAEGFPKNLDVAKAIDNAAGAERTEIRRPGAASGSAPDRGVYQEGLNTGFQQRELTEPVTDLAKTWDGYGTALKPAFEPIILARKPPDGTIAENVARWGVGGLDIAASKIEYTPDDLAETVARNPGREENVTSAIYAADRPQQRVDVTGRWPANVILSPGAGELLDAQAGERPSGVAVTRNGGGGHIMRDLTGHDGKGYADAPRPDTGYRDSGGASRFYFSPKVSAEERHRGCAELPDGNDHVAVKPIDLDRYLARLILPPARASSPRRIVVPYAGSGSEMIGALLAGWDLVEGIERHPPYLEILRARVKLAATNPRAFEPFAVRKSPKVDERQVGLFGTK